LQNPKDKRQILLDEKLVAIFKIKKFTMFSMHKYLTSLLIEDD
jgi:chromatin remodeling complex protein RSC6